ncbi:DNA-binding XRE family transcriptional regulator [Agrococcus sp. UYP10]|uniref:hypothetical protein n=1 Tax=Agrococcus sp. UYP10 TaxID=1756355 RepID=UPI003392B9B1
MRIYPFPKPKLGSDYSTDVIRWMGRNSLRRLHAAHLAGQPLPDEDALMEWICDITFAKAPHAGDTQQSCTKVEKQAMAAAKWALDIYDPEAKVYQRARLGGSNSRRGPSAITEANLDRLRALEGRSKAQQAKDLGVSTSTIASMRKELKRRDAEAAEMLEREEQDDFEALFAASTGEMIEVAHEPSPLDYLLEAPQEDTFSAEPDALFTPAHTQAPACSAQAVVAALEGVPACLFDDIDLEQHLIQKKRHLTLVPDFIPVDGVAPHFAARNVLDTPSWPAATSPPRLRA